MANRAYLRFWTREFSPETMIAQFVRFLATVPLSSARNSFDLLIIQAVDPTETPVSEWDFREGTFGAAEVAAIAAEQEAGAAAEAEAQAAAENEAKEAPADEAKPGSDESKEG